MGIDVLNEAGDAGGVNWDWRWILAGVAFYVLLAVPASIGIRKLLPPRRSRLVSWTAFEVLTVFFLVSGFWPSAVSLVVTETGLGERIYGAELMKQLRTRGGPQDSFAGTRISLLVTTLALPFQLATIAWLPLVVSRTPPYRYGLTGHRLGRNALLGLLGWVVLTPVVLGVNAGVSEFFEAVSRNGVSKHPLETLSGSGSLSAVETGMIVFLAVVSAPIVEELLFRGVLQGWLTRNLWGSHVVVGITLTLAFPWSGADWRLLSKQRDLETFVQVLSPLAFVLALLPVYALVCRWGRTPAGPALLATALLFAMVHRFAWPSPVPLFVLALGLGWLARRTQSLVGPMVLHALFNGVACVQMLFLTG